MTILYGSAVSPYAIKARWALEYHDTPYVRKDGFPPITNLVVGRKLGNHKGRITYPVLVKDDDFAMMESFGISKWSSENIGPNSRGNLFAGFDLGELNAWDTKAQEMVAYGRIYGFDRILQSNVGLMPTEGPLKWLAPLGNLLVRKAIGQLRAKYINVPGAGDIDNARAHLSALREAIKGDDPYILGKFSFADVTMAVAMMVVEHNSHTPIPNEILEASGPSPFGDEYSDLVKWRDEIFEQYFVEPRSSS